MRPNFRNRGTRSGRHVNEERRAALEEIALDRGTPCYVYFFDEVRDQIAALRETFGAAFGVSYAAKSNPNPGLLAALRAEVDTLDISSAGELDLALQGGWEPERISFTGPAKREQELRAALEHGIGEVVLESVEEALQLEALADQAERKAKVLVRIAPSWVPKGFGDSMAGKPAAFGIDEEVLGDALETISALPHLELAGFHIYSGTQCLLADSIAENYRIFIELFRRATELTGIRPEKLVFGAGIGIPYHEGQEAVDLAAVWEGIRAEVEALRAEDSFRDTTLLLETGRFLVGEAGGTAHPCPANQGVPRYPDRNLRRGVEQPACSGRPLRHDHETELSDREDHRVGPQCGRKPLPVGGPALYLDRYLRARRSAPRPRGGRRDRHRLQRRIRADGFSDVLHQPSDPAGVPGRAVGRRTSRPRNHEILRRLGWASSPMHSATTWLSLCVCGPERRLRELPLLAAHAACDRPQQARLSRPGVGPWPPRRRTLWPRGGRRYFRENGIPEDGGYEDDWVRIQLGPIPFRFPNTQGRKRGVRLHDLNHVVTGYRDGPEGRSRDRCVGTSVRLHPVSHRCAVESAGFSGRSCSWRRAACGEPSYAADTPRISTEKCQAKPSTPRAVAQTQQDLGLDRAQAPATIADRIGFLGLLAAIVGLQALIVGVFLVLPFMGLRQLIG